MSAPVEKETVGVAPATAPAQAPATVEAVHAALESKNLHGTSDIERIEAPVTWKAYMICAFASFGGIFFGYDSGYINNTMGLETFVHVVQGPDAEKISGPNTSLIVSILSLGTFLGAIIAGDLADFIGRKWTVILGCVVYMIGCVPQTITGHGNALAALVVGRLIAGFGVGFVSAIVILYMSEICPRKVRGSLVAGYQFCITIGIMTASCVVYGTKNYQPAWSSFQIPIALQFLWAAILAGGLLMLPESPRYYVKKGRGDDARAALARLRGQPADSQYITDEVTEIIANHECELALIPTTTWFGSWAQCFKGSLWEANSNLRKTILGTSLQMMQQWTGINFIFYYSTPFLQSTGAIGDTFLISMIFTIINVFSTPISFYTVEKFGRRALLIWGALGMLVCEFLVAIIGVTVGFNKTHKAFPDITDENDPNFKTMLADNISAVNAQIAFIAIYIFFFASTWGPGAWIVIGEIFPIPIRSRGVGLSTASNWLWNCIIAVITPYMVDENEGNLRSSVFFVWGALCTAAFVYAYFLVPETKGLSLEQVDQLMADKNFSPRKSAKWRPTTTYATMYNATGLGHKEEAVV